MNLYTNNVVSLYSYNEISKFINTIDFPYAVVKGEVLSVQAYNKVFCRNSCDVDFIIHRSNVKKFENILLQHGFTRNSLNRRDEIMLLSSSHQMPTYEKEIPDVGTVVIDVNFDIFWGEYIGRRIDMNEFLSDVKPMELFKCKVNVLPPLKALLQVCLHHYKEMNSLYHLTRHNSINCNMFSDIYYLWKNNITDLCLEKLINIGREYDISCYLYYILYYTNCVFKDKELQKYVDTFCTDEGKRILNCYGLSVEEQKEWRADFEERLNTNNLYELIKDDLTNDDLKKIKRVEYIFS